MDIELIGADFLRKELLKFGPVVAKRSRDVGVRKAAVYMRRELKKDAPRGKTKTLRNNIGYKYSRKSGKAWVGLRPRKKDKGSGTKGGVFYYKTLDFGRPQYTRPVRGNQPATGPMNPWFVESARRASDNSAQVIIKETTKALYTESGKVYTRSKRNNDMKGKFGGRRRRLR